jgi:seryl-tRNA synthetase
MKEGYLQEKMREFDYKLKQQMDVAKQLDKHLDRIIVSEKEQKKMFKKLKDLDKYKEEIKKEINREIKEELKIYKSQSKETIRKKIDDAIEKKLGDLQKQMDELKIELMEIKELKDLVLQATKNAIYSEQLSNLLVEELVRERIFSREKTDIITKRASIRTRDKLKQK